MAEKAPRWTDDPAPGFKPDGTSLITPPGEKPKFPEEMIEVDGALYTPEEYQAILAEQQEDDDDLSDLEELSVLGEQTSE